MKMFLNPASTARALKVSVPMACLLMLGSLRADPVADAVAGFTEKKTAANSLGTAMIAFGIVVAIIFFVYKMVKR